MPPITSLPATLSLLVGCWIEVESRVRRLIAERYTVHDEVFINRLLYGELSVRFREANENGAFTQAVLADLCLIATTSRLIRDARRITKGIVARASYHEPAIEAVTGADMGLTVVRPDFSVTDGRTGFRSWLHEQGLLCQAKRQKENRKWGLLSPSQESVLPEHVPYLALLLYGYRDSDRHELDPFAWKPCAGMDIGGVQSLLRSGSFGQTLRSGETIDALGNGRIGTNDIRILTEVICAGETAHLKLEITWAGGPPTPNDGPGPSNGLLERPEHEPMTQTHQHHMFARQAQALQRHMGH